MKKHNNSYYLDLMLAPWIGLADDDNAIMKYRSVDPNDEKIIKAIIISDLMPSYRELAIEVREKIKDAFREELSKNTLDFRRELEGLLPPFPSPKLCIQSI